MTIFEQFANLSNDDIEMLFEAYSLFYKEPNKDIYSITQMPMKYTKRDKFLRFLEILNQINLEAKQKDLYIQMLGIDDNIIYFKPSSNLIKLREIGFTPFNQKNLDIFKRLNDRKRKILFLYSITKMNKRVNLGSKILLDAGFKQYELGISNASALFADIFNCVNSLFKISGLNFTYKENTFYFCNFYIDDIIV